VCIRFKEGDEDQFCVVIILLSSPAPHRGQIKKSDETLPTKCVNLIGEKGGFDRREQ